MRIQGTKPNNDIMNELNKLYIELETVLLLEEQEVCKKYNADSKEEILALIHEEICELENSEKENLDENGDDDGMDYTAICVSQSLGRYC